MIHQVDAKHFQLITRLNFYINLISELNVDNIFNAARQRLSELASDDYQKFDKQPLLDENGKPFELTDYTFPYHLTGDVEIFGIMPISEVDGKPVFIGIHGEALRAILSQDFEKITSMRFETKHVQIAPGGIKHNIYISNSGLALSSMTQPQ